MENIFYDLLFPKRKHRFVLNLLVYSSPPHFTHIRARRLVLCGRETSPTDQTHTHIHISGRCYFNFNENRVSSGLLNAHTKGIDWRIFIKFGSIQGSSTEASALQIPLNTEPLVLAYSRIIVFYINWQIAVTTEPFQQQFMYEPMSLCVVFCHPLLVKSDEYAFEFVSIRGVQYFICNRLDSYWFSFGNYIEKNSIF